MATTGEVLPVLIVGAGPVGLSLACFLRHAGIECRIIDKDTDSTPENISRAVVTHAKTLELLQELPGNPAKKISDHGFHMTHANNYSASGERLLHIDLTKLLEGHTKYPYACSLKQGHSERVFIDTLKGLGGAVERQTTLVGFKELRNEVEAELSHDDKGTKEIVRCKYIAGCDGAHSTVRKTLGIPFNGNLYSSKLVIADAYVEWDYPPDGVSIFLNPEMHLTMVPMPDEKKHEHPQGKIGYYRITLGTNKVPPDELALNLGTQHEPQHGPTTEQITMEKVQEFTDVSMKGIMKIHSATWTSSFRVSNRHVSQYSKGRAFLCGDAAHIHSPAGAQGMNSGLQDANNLGWKLALVLKGYAPPSLLDTYNEERHTIEEKVIGNTRRMFELVSSAQPLITTIRDHAMPYVSALSPVQHTLAETFAMLNHKAQSAIVKTAGGEGTWLTGKFSGKVAGSRAPDSHVADHKTLYDITPTQCYKQYLMLFLSPFEEQTPEVKKEYFGLERIALQTNLHYNSLGLETVIVVPRNMDTSKLRWKNIIKDTENTLYNDYMATDNDAAYIMRPDRYIGFACKPINVDQITEYLDFFYQLSD